MAASLGKRQRADGVRPTDVDPAHLDGARDGGRTPPKVAAQKARALHVPVYTILLGTPAGVVQHKLPGGYTETIRVPPSAATLSKSRARPAATSSPRRTTSAERGLHQLRSRLGHKTESREVTDLFAGGAALLLLAGGALSALWFRRVP
jgi:Ca-activated chloride channel family protein